MTRQNMYTSMRRKLDRADEAAALAAVPVPGRPGYYMSRKGRMYSARSVRADEPMKIRRPSVGTSGYPAYAFKTRGATTSVLAHHLVAQLFLGPRPFPGAELRHLDGNKLNASADNLGWGSAVQNEADKRLHGTDGTGERNSQAKLNQQTANAIRLRLIHGATTRAIARELGVSQSCVQRIKTGEAWK